VSYGEFLVLFLGIPLAAVALTSRPSRRLLVTLAVLSVVAVVYTAPWDNLIITQGVWSYGPRQVLGVVIGHVPLEEYIFYVLQVFLAGLVMAGLYRRFGS